MRKLRGATHARIETIGVGVDVMPGAVWAERVVAISHDHGQ